MHMDNTMPITVMVVDDHQMVREGLISMLQAAPQIQVVGQAASGPEAIRKVGESKPNVILLDIRLPVTDGLDLCRALQIEVPESRAIMLTSYHEEHYLFEALRAGAWGYLSKTASHEEIVETITSVAKGRRLLSASLVDRLVVQYADLARELERLESGFDKVEMDILRLVAKGATSAEIAQRIHLSEASVRHRLQAIYDRLGVEDRASAAVQAMRRGLI